MWGEGLECERVAAVSERLSATREHIRSVRFRRRKRIKTETTHVGGVRRTGELLSASRLRKRNPL